MKARFKTATTWSDARQFSWHFCCLTIFTFFLGTTCIAEEVEVHRSDLKVTLGSVSETRSGYLTVDGPKERGFRKVNGDRAAVLQFRYRGPSKQIAKSSNGKVVRQIGLKLLAMDTCNLLYVMWRIEPDEEILVTMKRNPGQSTHNKCGGNGYNTIARIGLTELGITARTHAVHRLKASIHEQSGHYRCTVSIDEKEIWSGEIDSDLIAGVNGPIGFRSDNGDFIFKFFASTPEINDQ